VTSDRKVGNLDIGTRTPRNAGTHLRISPLSNNNIAAIIPKKEAAATAKKLSAHITADLDRGCQDLFAALFLYF
jgi:hypothetical protein